jgi:hypothetical protein
MRKSYSVRLHLSQSEGDEVKRICAAEERSQAEVLSMLVRSGLQQYRAATADAQEILAEGQVAVVRKRLVSLLRGEQPAEQ